MDPKDSNTELKQKLEKCISDSMKIINEELKSYSDIVQKGLEIVSRIFAHKTTLNYVKMARIEQTELFEHDSLIQQRLEFAIETSINSEESDLVIILNNLESSFRRIMTQVDKVFNVYNSCNMDVSDITKGSEMSESLAEKLCEFDYFRKHLCLDHGKRRHTQELHLYQEDLEKETTLWNSSNLKKLQTRLNFRLDSLAENNFL